MFKKFLCLLGLSFMLCSCTKTTTLRTAANHDQILNKANNIYLMHPEVVARQVEAGGKIARLDNYEYLLEDLAPEVLIPKLEDKGYKVKMLRRTEVKDLGIVRSVVRIRDDFSKAIPELYTKVLMPVKDSADIDYNLKLDATKSIAVKTATDILAYTEIYSSSRSRGAYMKDFAIAMFVPGQDSSYGMHPYMIEPNKNFAEAVTAIVVIADAKTGKLLWSNLHTELYGLFSCMGSSSNGEKDRKRLDEIYEVILKELPERVR